MRNTRFIAQLGRTLGAALGGLLLLLVWNYSTVGAAAEPDPNAREEITLSPAVQKISAEPGELKTDTFKVLNTGERSFDFTVYARPYSVETENYSPNYEDTPKRSNLYRWVQFDKTGGNLEPGEEMEISYTILVPDNAEAGGHYGVLFAETVPNSDDGQVVIRNKRVGSIIRLSVGGDIEHSGKVESQSISWLQTRPPLTATARVSNTGNVDFDAATLLRVTTVFGREVYKSEVPYAVYPGKPRQISTGWENASALGVYKVEQTIDVLGETSQVSSYVLMLPRWAIIILLMVVVAGGAYVAYRRLR